MASNPVRAVVVAILAGLAGFMVLMGAGMALVMLNARATPELAWFPVPVFAACIGASVFAERRWRIGLTHPPGVAWGRVYFLALATTVVGISACILQGAWSGMTRAAELGPDGTGASFRLAYAFVMPVVAAILAEVAFRGIMQARLHAVLAPLPAIVLVAAVNTAAHRWGPDLAAQWLGYFVLLAGCGWVRWLGGSVLPALAAHVAQNLALAALLYGAGPFDLGALTPAALAVTAATGGVALVVTVVASQPILRRNSR